MMRPPRIIGRFTKDDVGVCYDCKEKHSLAELALVARCNFDESIFEFNMYCYDCFSDLSDGDDNAWREAYQSSASR